VVSCFASHSINEIAHYSLKKYDSDIAIVCNLNSMSVSFRKNKERCSMKLNKLAEILCDGGGHEYAAGGKVTDKFIAFTKTLNKI
jgi:oligoribonuclease NrnB/cAMP/cGMP phosphodiesterase (DHH superfamily)